MFSIFRKPLTVTRHEPGQYVSGVWIEGETETLTVHVSVQPTSPEDMQSLPEGRRERKAYTLFGDARLRSVEDGANPDRVEIAGHEYEVVTSSEWRNGIINHNRSIVQRVDS
jgi:hypothetical protein